MPAIWRFLVDDLRAGNLDRARLFEDLLVAGDGRGPVSPDEESGGIGLLADERCSSVASHDDKRRGQAVSLYRRARKNRCAREVAFTGASRFRVKDVVVDRPGCLIEKAALVDSARHYGQIGTGENACRFLGPSPQITKRALVDSVRQSCDGLVLDSLSLLVAMEIGRSHPDVPRPAVRGAPHDYNVPAKAYERVARTLVNQ